MPELTVASRLVGVHLVCDLCGDHAHVSLPPDATDDQSELDRWLVAPGSLWMDGHLWPRLHAVDVMVNGHRHTYLHT